jgi:hypothetical protein
VEIVTEAAQFLFWEFFSRIFHIVSLQCSRQRKNSLKYHFLAQCVHQLMEAGGGTYRDGIVTVNV